jgi:hypothetical protein
VRAILLYACKVLYIYAKYARASIWTRPRHTQVAARIIVLPCPGPCSSHGVHSTPHDGWGTCRMSMNWCNLQVPSEENDTVRGHEQSARRGVKSGLSVGRHPGKQKAPPAIISR